jgi:hypothetical protein
MKKRSEYILMLMLLCFVVTASFCVSLFATDDSSELALNPVLDIPLITNPVKIDGDVSDWQDNGLRRSLTVLLNSTLEHTAKDFYPSVRVAWCDKGILLFISVMDDDLVSTSNPEEFDRGDGIELGLHNADGGAANLLQSALFFQNEKSVVFKMWKLAKLPEKLQEIKIEAKKSDIGYDVEILLPWSCFFIKNTPSVGNIIHLQIAVRDLDSRKSERGSLKRSWHMRKYVYSADWECTRPLRLSEKASELLDARASAQYRDGGFVLDISASKNLSGKKFTAEMRGKLLAEGVLQESEIEAVVKNIPLSIPKDILLKELKISVDGNFIPCFKNTDYVPAALNANILAEKTGEGFISCSFAIDNPPEDLMLVNPRLEVFVVNEDTDQISFHQKIPYGEKLVIPLEKKGRFRIMASLQDPLSIGAATLLVNDGEIVPRKQCEKIPVIVIPTALDCRNASTMACFVNTINRTISSSLSKKYDCIMLNRAQSLDMKTEKDIGNISAVIEGDNATGLPAADHIVVIRLQKPKKQALYDPLMTVEMFIYSLENNDVPVKSISSPIANTDALADIIAYELGLRKKDKKETQKSTGNLKWAILPFFNLADKKLFQTLGGLDAEMPVLVELALQNSDPPVDLVDHKAMQKVLDEITMATGGVSFNSVSSIAKIVKADRALLFSVSDQARRIFERDLECVDALLVDPANNAIIDAESAICWHGNLAEIAATIAKKLVKRNQESVKLPPASTAMRHKEAELLLQEVKNTGNYSYFPASWSAFALQEFESVYALAYDNPEMMGRVITLLKNFLVSFGKRSAPMQKHRFAYLAKQALKHTNVSYLKTDPEMLMISILYSLGHDMEAIKLLEEKAKSLPKEESAQWRARAAFELLIKEYIKKKEYSKALDVLNNFYYRDIFPFLYIEIYQKINEPEKELAFLEKLNWKHFKSAIGTNDTTKALRAKVAIEYINLAKRLKGSQYIDKALTETIPKSVAATEAVAFERAKLKIEIGGAENIGMADLYLNAVNNDSSVYEISLAEDKSPKEIQKEINDLLSKITGKSDPKYTKYYTGKELNPMPENLKFYLQPLGMKSTDELKKAAVLAGDFFGTKVVVLDNIPLPIDNSEFFIKDLGRYDLRKLMYYAGKKALFPDDALIFLFITDLECVFSCQDCGKVHKNVLTEALWFDDAGAAITCSQYKTTSDLAKNIVKFVPFFVMKTYNLQGLNRENYALSSMCPDSIYTANTRHVDKILHYLKLGMDYESIKHYEDIDFKVVKAGMDKTIVRIKSKQQN